MLQRLPDGLNYRLCEADGRPCCRWLPWEPATGPLDKGGFPDLEDALAFALGIDRHRAEAGLIGGRSVQDIDQERHELDGDRRKRRYETKPAIPEFAVA